MKQFSILFVLLLCDNAFSQTTCVNSGFESSQPGSYNYNPSGVAGWTVSSRSSTACLTPSLSWSGGSPKFSLLATPVIDGVIGTIPHSPLGGTVVALLNNASSPYYVTTRLAQTFSVTNANQYFNFAFATASNDGTHQLCCENPACYFQLKDANGNVLSCFSESVAPSSTCASAVSLTITGAWSYTNWKVRTLNLAGLVGSTATFEAIVKDCNFGAHCG
jgi:hypothetical protein